jgi:arsenite methyltransferase
MNESLLEVLVDPISGQPLAVEIGRVANDDIVEGTLETAAHDRKYQISNGIPRLVLSEDRDQQITTERLAYTWARRETYDSPEVRSAPIDWMCLRHGFADVSQMRSYVASHRRILDAGCGSALSSSFCMEECWADSSGCEWYGLEISGAIDVALDRIGPAPSRHFIQGDILQPPLRKESFDLVFCEGVLHHMRSTEEAFKSLVPLIAPGGELFCYVYRKKAPLREFADGHVRQALSSLPPEEVWNAVRPLTALAKALSDLHAEVELDEPIPFLGIPAGKHAVQRLVYWHMFKLFWNPDFDFETNNHINFDWYAPRYAHRQTEADLRQWCAESDMEVEYLDDSDQAGLTLHARKPWQSR